MNNEYTTGKAIALIKEAAEKKKLQFTPEEKIELGGIGMKGAQDEADGTPGKQKGESVKGAAMGGALSIGAAGAYIGGTPKLKQMKHNNNNIIRVGGGAKGALKGAAIGALGGGAAFGGLGNMSYNYGSDHYKKKQEKKKA